ncbi:MAG: ABC transporter permease [Gemmatimonadota bacterium]
MANIVIGFDALRIHPLRTMLSVLGIIIGSASLVATMAVNDGMMAFARGQIEQQTSVQVIAITSRTIDYQRGGWVAVTGYPVFGMTDADAARRDIRGVGAVTITLSGSSVARYRGVAHQVQAKLGTAELPEFEKIDLAAGRFFTGPEANHNASVVVVNYALAREIAPGSDPLALVGTDIQVKDRPRRVIGVLASNPYEEGRFPTFMVYAPLRAATAVLFPPATGRFTPSLELKAPSVESVMPLRDAAVDWLARRYARWEDRVRVTVGLERLAEVEKIFLLAKFFFGALVGISLIVGGIGIMNVLLASVTERTREIGIRKAVGAREADIRTQFLAESVAIAGVGTIIGLVLGLVLAVAVTAVFRMFVGASVHARLAPSTVVIAIVSSSVVGLAFGTYPARRAASLRPIEAIAHE